MLIKNFQADSMHDAMKKVKQEFGNEAVILNTQVFEEKAKIGTAIKKRFEITAGKDVPKGSRIAKSPSVTSPAVESLNRDEKRLISDVGLVIRRFEKEIGYLVQSQKEIRTLLRTPADSREICADLEMHDIEKDLIVRILEQIPSNGEGQSHNIESLRAGLLRECVQPQPIKIFASGSNKVVFVGPPAAGKSALLTKIAANLVFQRKIKCSLVNMDDYKPYAGKSLSAYADLLKIDYQEEDAWNDKHIYDDFTVVLADTKGVTIGARDDLIELKSKLDWFGPDEIHLVLPAYCSWREIERWLDFYSVLSPTQIAITFFDQTSSFGLPFNLSGYKGMKLSYFSWGRNKVSDLEVADLFRLSDKLFDEVEDFNVHVR
jgi:flagellar biosynthesis protein FlhF